MDPYFLFMIFVLLLFAGIAFLIMRFFRKWTMKSPYGLFFNILIFIASYLVVFFIAAIIFFSTVSFER